MLMVMRRRFLPFRRRIGHRPLNKWAVLTGLLLTLSLLLYLLLPSSPTTTTTSGDPVVQVVNQFYNYEKKGDFGSSWDLFHPQMQERFTKEAYIQQRAHIFMQQFGVDTFDFKLGSSEAVSSWQMSSKAPVFTKVHKVPVTQFYNSRFGNFALQQDVYVAQEADQWLILWAYSN
jgi:hypothetical protein